MGGFRDQANQPLILSDKPLVSYYGYLWLLWLLYGWLYISTTLRSQRWTKVNRALKHAASRCACGCWHVIFKLGKGKVGMGQNLLIMWYKGWPSTLRFTGGAGFFTHIQVRELWRKMDLYFLFFAHKHTNMARETHFNRNTSNGGSKPMRYHIGAGTCPKGVNRRVPRWTDPHFQGGDVAWDGDSEPWKVTSESPFFIGFGIVWSMVFAPEMSMLIIKHGHFSHFPISLDDFPIRIPGISPFGLGFHVARPDVTASPGAFLHRSLHHRREPYGVSPE